MSAATTELERVKARIRALAAKTVDRGCSEAEALAAAQKVGELLEVYGLSMSEVELREETCLQREVVFADPRRSAMKWLFPDLLRFTECKGWTSGTDTLVVFGLEPDVLMAEYLLHVIAGALSHEEAVYRRTPHFAARRTRAQNALRSFRLGFASRLASRLKDLAEARWQTQQAARAAPRATDTGTALAALKQQRVEEEFGALGVRLRTVYRQATIRDRNAYRIGGQAGERVSLDRPVGAGAGVAALPAPSSAGRR
jgi:hypothetical protein